MGAFFLLPSDKTLSSKAISVFNRKGFSEPIELNFGNSTLYYYKKQMLDNPCILREDSFTIVSAGTCLYKKNSFPDNLRALLEDFRKDGIQRSELTGNFTILIYDGTKVSFLSDQYGQYAIYFCSKTRMISSSFLALVIAVATETGKLRLNRHAITEVLLTGNNVGADTYFQDIEHYLPSSQKNLPGIASILRNNGSCDKQILKEVLTDNLIEHQLELLEGLFTSWRDLFNRNSAVVGLTGGLDSRLLYLALRHHCSNYRLYMNTYNRSSLECVLAADFATAAEEVLETPVLRAPLEMDTSEFRSTIEDGFYFWDGICKVHHLWFEEKKSRSHLTKFYGKSRVVLSGVGGERYRNHNSLLPGKYNLRRWITWSLLYANSGKALINNQPGRRFMEFFESKIRTLLGLRCDSDNVTAAQIRHYYDVVYNTTNRTQRASIENQLCFCLSPFVEPHLGLVPESLIGRNMMLELNMIRKLAPDLKDSSTAYGFSPADTPSLVIRLLPYLKKAFGLPLFHWLKKSISTCKGTSLSDILEKHSFLEEYISKVNELDLPVCLTSLKGNDYLSPMLIETGMFLTELDDYIEHS